MKYDVKISIIVPVYNVEKYIKVCIESILNQSYINFELLLINDGSTDNSYDICKKYKELDSRIFIFDKKNEGVSATRNFGIEKATGEWICFVDSDDWLPNNYFEKIMEDTKLADITFWGAKFHYSDSSTTEYNPKPVFIENKNEIEKILLYLKENSQNFEYLGYTWNKLFKASIIKNNFIRFVTNLKLREDEVFTLEYAQYANSIRIKNDVYYNYRVINTGLTASLKKNTEYILLASEMERLIKNYNNNDFIQRMNQAILSYLFFSIIKSKPLDKIWYNQVRRFNKFNKIKRRTTISVKNKIISLLIKLNPIFFLQAIILLIITSIKKEYKK